MGKPASSSATMTSSTTTGSSTSGQRPVAFEEKTNCAICIRNLPVRGSAPSGKCCVFEKSRLQKKTRQMVKRIFGLFSESKFFVNYLLPTI